MLFSGQTEINFLIKITATFSPVIIFFFYYWISCMTHNIYATYYHSSKRYDKRIIIYKYTGIILTFIVYLLTIFNLNILTCKFTDPEFSFLLYDIKFINLYFLAGMGTLIYILNHFYLILKKNPNDFLTLNDDNSRDTTISMLFNALVKRHLLFIGYFIWTYTPYNLFMVIRVTFGNVQFKHYYVSYLSMIFISFNTTFSVLIKLTDPFMSKYLKDLLFYRNKSNNNIETLSDLREVVEDKGVSLLNPDEEEYLKMCNLITSPAPAFREKERSKEDSGSGNNPVEIHLVEEGKNNSREHSPEILLRGSQTVRSDENGKQSPYQKYPQNNFQNQSAMILYDNNTSRNHSDESFEKMSMCSAHTDNIHMIVQNNKTSRSRFTESNKSLSKTMLKEGLFTFDIMNYHIDISINLLRMVAISASINEDRIYDKDPFYMSKYIAQLPWSDDMYYKEKTGWSEYNQTTLPDWITAKNDVRFKSFKLKVKKFCPLVFHHVRNMDSVSIDDCIKSLNPIRNLHMIKGLKVCGGRGDNSILSTWDKKMLIKTISQQEKHLLKHDMIKEYHARMRDTKSLLCRIYGLFKIEINDNEGMHVLLMKNMCDLPQSTKYLTFDLKGSTVDRQCISLQDQAELAKCGNQEKIIANYRDQVLKDKDLALLGIKFNLYSHDAKNLLTCVDNDSKFLEKFAVTDYSLLVFMHLFQNEDIAKNFGNLRIMPSVDNKFLFNFSIVDFLATYDLERKGEKLAKDFVSLVKMMQDTNYSVQAPGRYGLRFRTRMKNLVVATPVD